MVNMIGQFRFRFFLRCDNQPEFDAIAFKRNNTLVLCDLKTKGCKHTSVTLFSWL